MSAAEVGQEVGKLMGKCLNLPGFPGKAYEQIHIGLEQYSSSPIYFIIITIDYIFSSFIHSFN